MVSKEEIKRIYEMLTINENEIEYMKKYGYFAPELRNIEDVAIDVID